MDLGGGFQQDVLCVGTKRTTSQSTIGSTRVIGVSTDTPSNQMEVR